MLEELSLKNKEMTNEMEKLRRVNEEVSLKNNELSLELDVLKKHQAEREPVRGNTDLGHSQGVTKIKSKIVRNSCTVLFICIFSFCYFLVQTRSACNGQVHEGTTTGNVAEEGWFDPAQLNRFINECHERQIKLTEIRKKLIEVCLVLVSCIK